MKTIPRHPQALCIMHCALCITLLSPLAMADGVAEATPRLFDLDTRAAYPVVSRTEPVALPHGAGATVTATAPGGAVTTLPAAVNGTNYWTATAGGIWTLVNSSEGTAFFAVRYTGAEQGAGTEASPWTLVDNDELSELSATDGFVFVLEGPLADLGEMSLPAGYAVAADGGAYRLAASADGAAFLAANAELMLDTMQPGPDRRVTSSKRLLPFAYTGDDWAFASEAASTLTFLSPDGKTTTVGCTGTGAKIHPLRRSGVWTVTLSGDAVTPLTALIDFTGDGTKLFVR